MAIQHAGPGSGQGGGQVDVADVSLSFAPCSDADLQVLISGTAPAVGQVGRSLRSGVRQNAQARWWRAVGLFQGPGVARGPAYSLQQGPGVLSRQFQFSFQAEGLLVVDVFVVQVQVGRLHRAL